MAIVESALGQHNHPSQLVETNLRESIAKQENRQDIWAVAVDFGSSGVKVGAVGMIDGRLSVYDQRPWIEWSTYTETISMPGIAPFRCVRGEKLDELLGLIKEEMRETAIDMQEKHAAPVVYAETGFTNSLVAEYALSTDDGKRKERVLFLDGPGLHMETIPLSDTNHMERHGVKADLKHLRISTIMKMMTLREKPDVIHRLFGDDVEFDDLEMTSMLGLLTDTFFDGSIINGLPLADIKGLGSADFIEDPEDAADLLRDMGIPFDQFHIDMNQMLPTFEHPVTARYNDWIAEAGLISELRTSRRIPDNAVIAAYDTVFKTMHPWFPFEKESSSSHERYTTQRVGGAIMSAWMKHLYPSVDGHIDFMRINAELKIALDDSNLERAFFFNPEDLRDQQDRGALWQIKDNKWQKVSPEDFAGLNARQKRDAALAIAEGAFFALRRKIDDVRGENEFPPVVAYGGLISHGLTSLESIFRQTFPNSIDIYKLDMDGILPLGFMAVKNTGRDVDWINVNINLIPNPPQRVTSYSQWLETSTLLQR